MILCAECGFWFCGDASKHHSTCSHYKQGQVVESVDTTDLKSVGNSHAGSTPALPTIEFCRECGTSFPPRDGEGRCKDWQSCQRKQLEG